jgi:molybdenum-dependent DNA-binding transcriptional regulator ModE
VKVWLEGQDGRVTLSDWRVGLLAAIARRGSLVGAARELGVPHRTAWQRLHQMEERLETRLVEASRSELSGTVATADPLSGPRAPLHDRLLLRGGPLVHFAV